MQRVLVLAANVCLLVSFIGVGGGAAQVATPTPDSDCKQLQDFFNNLACIQATPTMIAGTPVHDHGCSRLQEYSDTLAFFAGKHPEINAIYEYTFDPIQQTAKELLNLANGIDGFVENMDTMNPAVPPIAESYQQAYRTWFVLYAGMLRGIASAGTIGALPYTDELAQAKHEIDVSAYVAYQTCGSQWSDVFGVPPVPA